MNLTRVVLASIAAFVAYLLVGGVAFVIPAMGKEFSKFPAVYRSGEQGKPGVMAVGMFGIFLAIAVAAVVFARMHPTGAAAAAGLEYGVLLAVFVLGSFVLHNYMMLNISSRLSVLQAVVYALEWIAVGVVISLIYRP